METHLWTLKSNLQIHFFTPTPTWVSHVIHGTNAGKPEDASLKCTKSVNLRWVVPQVTPKFNLSASIWFVPWVVIKNSVPCVWTTETLAGLVKVFQKRHVSSMWFTTLL